MTEYERFWLVFTKTRVYEFGLRLVNLYTVHQLCQPAYCIRIYHAALSSCERYNSSHLQYLLTKNPTSL
jgi:hypothetical protein